MLPKIPGPLNMIANTFAGIRPKKRLTKEEKIEKIKQEFGLFHGKGKRKRKKKKKK